MSVIDEVYLVGKVIEVNYTNSRVLLLSDFNSKIPVLLEPIGVQGVASGTGSDHGEIQYTKDDYKDEIRTKEIIVYTSGIGGLFKPGIPVGKIQKEKINIINFFSDFKQLEYVRIVSYDIEGNK
jgi:rod shape-determining protein MreC